MHIPGESTDAARVPRRATFPRSSAKDLDTLLRVGAIGQEGDAELLTRFATGRGDAASEAAFEVLVARHGPMVLGVCRRVLGGDPHASADAFQATFLILVRKASTIRVDGSLGRWLYGVSLRVARRARTLARRERARAGSWPAFDPPAPDSRRDDDLRSSLDAEIARLPARYRSAVILCDIEGLSHEQVARRLRCPIGTVHSRLHRARERLRSSLALRGLAPTESQAARGVVPPTLLAATVTAASRYVVGGRVTGVVPAAVVLLTRKTWKEVFMLPGWCTGMIWTVVGLVATGAVAPGGRQDEAKAPAPGAETRSSAPESSIADRFARIRAEYDAQEAGMRKAQDLAKTRREREEVWSTLSPDLVSYCRRMIDLATTDIAAPASRDALLWVLDFPGRSDEGPYGDEFDRAASLLVRHHGDDPEAVRIGLGISNLVSRHRDALVTGLLASAKGREARGLARMAMARYLQRKALFATAARKANGRGKRRIEIEGDDGKMIEKTVDQSDEAYAYQLEVRQCDPDFLRAESERLYAEVIAEYGDIPYISVRSRNLEAQAARTAPPPGEKPLTEADRRQIEAFLANRKTLGQVATEHLDAMHNLAVGRPAPDIVGVDFDGKPLKLSDYRGKVVVLTFWSSKPGDRITRRLAHERELAERLKDKAIAILGVNCDGKRADALRTLESERITWPNWHDPSTETSLGPIASRYHLRSVPTSYYLDASGVIRYTDYWGIGGAGGIDKVVDDLLAEQAAKVPR